MAWPAPKTWAMYLVRTRPRRPESSDETPRRTVADEAEWRRLRLKMPSFEGREAAWEEVDTRACPVSLLGGLVTCGLLRDDFEVERRRTGRGRSRGAGVAVTVTV